MSLPLVAWLSALAFLSGLRGEAAVSLPSSNAPPQFLRFSVSDGLSHSSVQAMLRDRTGFLWVGTEDGLNRYDGYTFTVFRHQAGREDGLADGAVTSLCEDASGRLWVGTRGGVSLYDHATETFRLVLTSEHEVGAVVAGEGGAVWVGTLGGGLSELGGEGRTLAQYGKDAGALRLADDHVSALLRDASGALWIGAASGSLASLETRGERRLERRPDAGAPILALAEDDRSDVWVGTTAGVRVFDRAGWPRSAPEARADRNACSRSARTEPARCGWARIAASAATRGAAVRLRPIGTIRGMRTR
jgi:ligand-binding sensor domain-containing protein